MVSEKAEVYKASGLGFGDSGFEGFLNSGEDCQLRLRARKDNSDNPRIICPFLRSVS